MLFSLQTSPALSAAHGSGSPLAAGGTQLMPIVGTIPEDEPPELEPAPLELPLLVEPPPELEPLVECPPELEPPPDDEPELLAEPELLELDAEDEAEPELLPPEVVPELLAAEVVLVPVELPTVVVPLELPACVVVLVWWVLLLLPLEVLDVPPLGRQSASGKSPPSQPTSAKPS